MNFYVFKKEKLLAVLTVAVVLIVASVWLLSNSGDTAVFSQQSNEPVREIDMITAEFMAKTENGKETVAYRWDPGTIFLQKGERVDLYISEFNGEDHPFHIEGTDISGTLQKGGETVVPLQFEKEGTYRLICETHAHRDHSIPMIAYIVVN